MSNPHESWAAPQKEGKHITPLRVSNSLSGGTVVDFVPQNSNEVRWYGCGPTVYDAAHMGHARNYLTFDILRRLMTFLGYNVKMCMNITDIDDKIIIRSQELGVPFDQLARFWENDFFEDMQKLNCLLPDVVTRVSEYIPQILEFISKITSNGYAYVSGGSVYFDIDAFKSSKKTDHFYGRMEPGSVTDSGKVLEGEGALTIQPSEKRSPNDFALWKKAKDGEPSWPSPWGPGRPGWHIECSTMASDILGFPLDIHSGGIDLRFPHHDNELAQSEAAFDKPHWVNYFLHSGHLHIKGSKMSKSLKNFITIKDILEEANPRVLRILVLMHKWDAPFDYTPDETSMREPREVDRTISSFFANIRATTLESCKLVPKSAAPSAKEFTDAVHEAGLMSNQGWTPREVALDEQLDRTQASVYSAICDNFNTVKVMQELVSLISATNTYMMGSEKPRGPLLTKIGGYIFSIVKTLGLTNGEERSFNYAADGESSNSLSTNLLDAVCEFRNQVREKSKAALAGDRGATQAILDACDAFRDRTMVDLGVRLEDKGEKGFVWSRGDPAELRQEIIRREADTVARQQQKNERLREQREAAERKEKEAACPPELYYPRFKADEFSEFDVQTGLPTKLADGQPVSKGRLDKLKKALEKHSQVHANWLKTHESDGGGQIFNN